MVVQCKGSPFVFTDTSYLTANVQKMVWSTQRLPAEVYALLTEAGILLKNVKRNKHYRFMKGTIEA